MALDSGRRDAVSVPTGREFTKSEGSKMAIRIRHVVASAAFTIIAAGFAAAPVTAWAQPLTPESERAAHPRIAQSIADSEAALHLLEAAPDDFGGYKAQAINDLRAAIHSLKRALYFRLKMDDAAIDRIR
jgi:hypothetical protein